MEEYNQCIDSNYIEEKPEFICVVDTANMFDFLTENV